MFLFDDFCWRDFFLNKTGHFVFFSREIKLRRAVEETGKQLETERANLENALRHIAQELEDLKKLLEQEQEQCRLKDELYREQKKQNESIILESQKVCWAYFYDQFVDVSLYFEKAKRESVYRYTETFSNTSTAISIIP